MDASQELIELIDISDEEMDDFPESIIKSSMDVINSNEPKRSKYQNIFVRLFH